MMRKLGNHPQVYGFRRAGAARRPDIPALAAQTSPVAPKSAQLKAAVDSAYAKFRGSTSGKNADYIPYLAQVNPRLFGIAVVTTDNRSSYRG